MASSSDGLLWKRNGLWYQVVGRAKLEPQPKAANPDFIWRGEHYAVSEEAPAQLARAAQKRGDDDA